MANIEDDLFFNEDRFSGQSEEGGNDSEGIFDLDNNEAEELNEESEGLNFDRD